MRASPTRRLHHSLGQRCESGSALRADASWLIWKIALVRDADHIIHQPKRRRDLSPGRQQRNNPRHSSMEVIPGTVRTFSIPRRMKKFQTPPMKPARVFFLTSLAMIAFASNSLLCRLALRQTSIDAATFTLDRILSGAIALWLVIRIGHRHKLAEGRQLAIRTRSIYIRGGVFVRLP